MPWLKAAKHHSAAEIVSLRPLQGSPCHARFLWESGAALGHWWLISTLLCLWLEGEVEGTSQEWGLGRVLQTLGVSGSRAECSPS